MIEIVMYKKIEKIIPKNWNAIILINLNPIKINLALLSTQVKFLNFNAINGNSAMSKYADKKGNNFKKYCC